jgi:cysteine desulfurase
MIYLDHNATTPILPEVLEAMMPYLTTEWANPSSAYKFGAKLKSVIETAREQVAELIGAHPMDVIFTSCATEAVEVCSRQLTVKAFSILTVNCKL